MTVLGKEKNENPIYRATTLSSSCLGYSNQLWLYYFVLCM